jgi:Icc-related predicted phosphoesterase
MPLRFVYATDIHGDLSKYEKVYQFALDHDINLIHLGADLLPKGSDIEVKQKKFIKKDFKNFYETCEDKGIKVLSFFGNDDLYPMKKYYREYADLLDERPYTQDGYEFKAYGYVLDYPFGLKTACKLDYSGWRFPEEYISAPFEYTEKKGWETVKDLGKYFAKKGTIEDDLKKIRATDKTIMAIHMPPQSLNLDVCIDGRRVGSKAVLDWAVKNQPLVLLTGHIHESPSVTGTWKVAVGKTLVIQPGQSELDTVLVLIELEEDGVKTYLVKL